MSADPLRLGDKTLETLNGGAILAHVEIDDQGELQSFEQLEKVTAKIREESKKSPLLLIGFVHGWNNNATEDPKTGGGNLRDFRRTLEDVTKAQGFLKGRKPFGVFVSWRGRTVKRSSIVVDYFHRYSGARRAGGIAGTEILHEISATTRSARQENRILYVGHSFGGLVLENSISEVLTAKVAEAHATQKTLTPKDLPADLIVMVNAAQPALDSRQIVAALVNRKVIATQNDKAAPWMVSLTSAKDGATGGAFPTSTFLGRSVPPFNFFNTSVSGAYRKGDVSHNGKPWGTQRRAHSSTVGHFPPIHSHKPLPPVLNHHPAADLAAIIKSNLNPWAGHDIEVHGKENLYRFTAGDPDRYNRSPFWILQVPEKMIKDHNEIWTDDFIAMLTALMHLRDDSPVPAKPAPGVKPAVKMQLQSF